jgi:hypothetical protein
MNPLKTLFNKVFDTAPPESAKPPSDDAAFEWNPEEETVAPTSAKTISWKRGDTPDEGPKRIPGEATDADIAASAHNLPTPMFERNSPKGPGPRPAAPLPTAGIEPSPVMATRPESVARPSVLEPLVPPPAPLPIPTAAASAQSLVPPSDFEDVYRKAGIKSPVHGYGVERVYRLLTSRRLVGLDRSVRRSALLTALDAAGVPPSDVSQDAVLRRKALTAHEAEKALELQSLRSRNESRAEALQETVETFTRQKQSQIERLAQGSTSAVRAQSDLEIRKRMEQDRLYRSLAYFLEALPSPASDVRPALSESPRESPRMIERFDATIEMRPLPREEAPAPAIEPEVSLPSAPKEAVGPKEAPIEAEVVVAKAAEPLSASTPPLSQSGLEMALRAAAEEARGEGWGKTAVVEDSATSGVVDALRKLREANKPESES